MNTKTAKFIRGVQIFWSIFIGIGALYGSISLILWPQMYNYAGISLLDFMQVLPWPEVFFQNYIFPAICLFCANCLTNAVVLVLILKKNRLAPQLSMCCGLILMLWIVIQFLIFPNNPLSIAYFVFGSLQAICGLGWWKELRKPQPIHIK